MDKNKFVFFLPDEDFYKISYYDLYKEENVEIVDALIDSKSKIKRGAYLLCTSTKINQIVKIPGKELWFQSFYKSESSYDIIYFVFFDAQLRKYTRDYRLFLKRKYPNCRIVLFLTDLMDSFKTCIISEIISFADLILTYEKEDAKKYNFQYYPDVYSKFPQYLLESDYGKTNILFCGYTKNRSEMIINILNYLEKHKVCSEFIIPDLKTYFDLTYVQLVSSRLPYLEYIKKVQKANCILEIEQKGATGYTLRTLESLCYGKKLITNNTEIKNAPFYNENFIKVIEKAEDIDIEWITQGENICWGDIREYSPHRLMIFIQNYFRNKGGD